jgi:hypothetical protein
MTTIIVRNCVVARVAQSAIVHNFVTLAIRRSHLFQMISCFYVPSLFVMFAFPQNPLTRCLLVSIHKIVHSHQDSLQQNKPNHYDENIDFRHHYRGLRIAALAGKSRNLPPNLLPLLW